MSWETPFILAQIVGLAALILETFRFQMKSSRGFFYVEPILSSLYTAQFFLLNAHVATITSAIGIMRGVCGVTVSQDLLKKLIIYLFIPAYITVTFFIYENLIDLLPMTALLISSSAFLFKDNRYLVARLYIMNNLVWLAYAFNFSAYAQIATCVVVVTSLVIGIIRQEEFYQKKTHLMLNSWNRYYNSIRLPHQKYKENKILTTTENAI